MAAGALAPNEDERIQIVGTRIARIFEDGETLADDIGVQFWVELRGPEVGSQAHHLDGAGHRLRQHHGTGGRAFDGFVVANIGVEIAGESIKQGVLETSNVNVTEELVNLIQAQRVYEMNSKVLSTVDEMMSFLTQRT